MQVDEGDHEIPIPQETLFLGVEMKFVLCLRIVQHLPCFPQPCTDVTSLNAWLDSIPLYRNAYDGECKRDMLLSKWCGRYTRPIV